VVVLDKEKAKIFVDIWISKLSGPDPPNQFDEAFKAEVEEANARFLSYQNETGYVPVSMEELEGTLKQLKSRSAPGKDGIHNAMLQHLSPQFKDLLIELFNTSLRKGEIPEAWKEAVIIMIPKGDKDRKDPSNYRPISLTSCVSKVLERIVTNRLSLFLEQNGLLPREQSGFRKRRRTTDNLFSLTQKILQAFNRGEKAISFNFDIRSAYDSVWHDGLIFKMNKKQVPAYIVGWVKDFITDRSYVIKVGNEMSEMFQSKRGLPQGAGISPILWCFYSCDIPSRCVRDQDYTMTFADDHQALFIYKNVKMNQINVTDRAGTYLLEVEDWLSKWRLMMAPSKCSYTVFAKGNSTKNDFVFRLHGEVIPKATEMLLLGITFDQRLNFNSHVKNLKAKCEQRLRIIQILAHKSWQLTRSTLVSIYLSLIGSVLDYSAFMWPSLSKKNKSTLQAIQNEAVRRIFKKYRPTHTSTADLCTMSGLTLVRERANKLMKEYLSKVAANAKDLITELSYGNRTGNFGKKGKYKSRPCYASTYLITREKSLVAQF
jgi:hypothetical protein